jgi:hypothetical protein
MKPHSLPQHLRDLAVRVGLHEAGHHVVGRALGFKTGSCSIKIIGPVDEHIGGTEIVVARPLSSPGDILTYLENRVQVLYAGALAQSLKNGKVDHEAALECIRNHSGRNDYAKAKELIHLIRNIRFLEARDENDIQKQLDIINTELWNKAAEHVESDYEIIQGLGTRLADEVKAVNIKFELHAKVIDSLPKIIERFSLPRQESCA